MVRDEDDLMMITDGGMIVRTDVSGVPVYGRSTGGVIVMRLAEGSKLISFDIAAKVEEEASAEGEEVVAEEV